MLGIDYGLRRIGLALSDPTGTIASPLETLVRRAGKRPPITKLETIAREGNVEHLVVGLPLGLDGSENEWCAEVRSVGERLAGRLSVEVSFVDGTWRSGSLKCTEKRAHDSDSHVLASMAAGSRR